MTMIQLKQKLQHPFALVGQGFVAGIILFWATASGEGNAQASAHQAASEASPTH